MDKVQAQRCEAMTRVRSGRGGSFVRRCGRSATWVIEGEFRSALVASQVTGEDWVLTGPCCARGATMESLKSAFPWWSSRLGVAYDEREFEKDGSPVLTAHDRWAKWALTDNRAVKVGFSPVYDS